MNDLLLNISNSAIARTVIKSLKIPVPLPQPLIRQSGPWTSNPLLGKRMIIKSSENSLHTAALMEILQSAGAELIAENTPDTSIEKNPEGIIFDASGLKTPQDLQQIFDQINPLMRSLTKCGRILILGTPPHMITDPKECSVQYSLQGFCRSLAKECGKRGTTVQLIYCPNNLSTSLLETPLKFLLSDRASFISGQVIELSQPKNDTPALFAQNLKNKRALVTGAAQGIGAEIAKRLSEEGAEVVVLDRPSEQESLQKVADAIGGKAIYVDLAEDNVLQIIQNEAGESGFDIIVNNAGITRDKKFANLSAESWQMTLTINLGVVEDICTALLKKGLNHSGRIICLSSIAGIAGNVGQTNYATAKSGIIGFVEAMAPLAKKKGITINAIAPGFIETRMTAEIPTAIREVARRFNSLGQAGTPSDIAELAVLLAHGGSSAINGKTIRVCGQNLIGA